MRGSPDGWLKDFKDTSGYYLVTAALNALACMTGNHFKVPFHRQTTDQVPRKVRLFKLNSVFSICPDALNAASLAYDGSSSSFVIVRLTP